MRQQIKIHIRPPVTLQRRKQSTYTHTHTTATRLAPAEWSRQLTVAQLATYDLERNIEINKLSKKSKKSVVRAYKKPTFLQKLAKKN